jgi:hypothetical protein
MPGTMPDLTFNSWKNISIREGTQMQVLDDSSLLLAHFLTETIVINVTGIILKEMVPVLVL